jgi:beta-N-acetylhexosaminidase
LLDENVFEDREVFRSLAGRGAAVMVAHALAPALGEAACPTSLSRTVVGWLRAFAAPILADDLEMGALSSYGSVPERAAAALAAGCDQVMVCNALSARQEVAEHVEAAARRDPVLAATLRHAGTRSKAFGKNEVAEVGWVRVLELADRARALAGGGR